MTKTFTKIGALTGLALAMTMAAPLATQAAPAQVKVFNFGGSNFQASITTVRYDNNYSGYRNHRNRILPLAQVVKKLERQTGGTLTDIKLANNGKVYKFEGVSARGFIVEAKADAYTGQISDVNITAFRPHYDPKGLEITRLLAVMRNKGYHNFDLVSLKDEKGIYQVRGLDKKGKPVLIRALAKNGRILSTKYAPNYNGPSYARAEFRDFNSFKADLKKQNYSHFQNVVAYDDYYGVDARDGRGRNVHLEIDGFTGRILQD